ncbi:hypothetical protein [Streptomyces sp. NPDC003635]
MSVISSSGPPDPRTPPRTASARPAGSPSRSGRTAPGHDPDDADDAHSYDGGSGNGDFGGGD